MVLAAIYLAAVGIAARMLVTVQGRTHFFWYIGLVAAFLVLFSLVWVWQRLPGPALHGVFLVQAALVFALLYLDPDLDYVSGFYAVLAFQAAVVFRARWRWAWTAVLLGLTLVPLMVLLGPARGLGLALTTTAIGIALVALAIASQEIEAARKQSREMLARLESTNAELTQYAADVDYLAALQERNRLARELHDSVSQAMFSVLLTVRSAQLMRKTEPEAVPAQLELLQGLTQEALARMRGFIVELRSRS